VDRLILRFSLAISGSAFRRRELDWITVSKSGATHRERSAIAERDANARTKTEDWIGVPLLE
jgi:hypothetical protein